MARLPGYTFSEVVNKTVDGMGEVYGVVIHIMDGSFDGTKSWFNDTAAQASSHFGTARSGYAEQWVDTKDKAWAEMAGNGNYISIENEGTPPDALTDGQITRCSEILRWAHETYGVPYQLANAPGERGLGWHGMGGAAWGGHYDCPGDPIRAQFNEIIARASGNSQPVPSPTPAPSAPAWPGVYLKNYTECDAARQWQQRMSDRGWSITADGKYGPKSASTCMAFQNEKGLSADGIVGHDTWTETFRTDNVT